MNVDILHQDVQTLLEFFAKNCYRASDSSSESFFVSIIHNCANLFLTSLSWTTMVIVESKKRSKQLPVRQERSKGEIWYFHSKDLFTHLKNKEKSKSTLMSNLTDPWIKVKENVIDDIKKFVEICEAKKCVDIDRKNDNHIRMFHSHFPSTLSLSMWT